MRARRLQALIEQIRIIKYIHTTTNICSHLPPSFSQSCASLKRVLNLLCIFAIKPFCFLVEAHVALVDVVNVAIGMHCSAPAEFGSFINPAREKTRNEKKWKQCKGRRREQGERGQPRCGSWR